MKRLLAVLMAIAFASSAVSLAVAQTQKPTEEKKASTTDHKMAAKSAVGTVKSSTGNSVVIAGKSQGKDTEWTFALDPKTKIRKGGQDATAADLKAGDSVSVRYMEHDGKATAQAITVMATKLEGKPAGQPAEKK